MSMSPPTRSPSRPAATALARQSASPARPSIHAPPAPAQAPAPVSLSKMARSLLKEKDFAALRAKIPSFLAGMADAERGHLLLLSEDKTELIEIFRNASGQEEALHVPLAINGIAATVANTGLPLRVDDAHKDPRVKDFQVDGPGFSPVKSAFAVPVFDGEVLVAVAVMVNARSGVFTRGEEDLLVGFSGYCGIALGNARENSAATKAAKHKEALLRVSKAIFSQVSDMPSLLSRISSISKELLEAEVASVFTLDRDAKELMSVVFERSASADGSQENPSRQIREIRLPMDYGIAGAVATSGKALNIPDAYADPRFNASVDTRTGFRTRCILCLPVTSSSGEVVGVVQMLNKIGNRVFTKEDEAIFSEFATFFAIAFASCSLFQAQRRLAAQYRVAQEVATYHLVAPVSEADSAAQIALSKSFRESHPGIESLLFDHSAVSPDETPAAVLYMFDSLGLSSQFSIPPRVVVQFVATVRNAYRNVPYHNFMHAFAVTQTMFAIATSCGEIDLVARKGFTRLDLLCFLVACLCHDMDHRATTNAFQVLTASALGELYGAKSVMEKHHFAMTTSILSVPGHNIFGTLPVSTYRTALEKVQFLILSTDPAGHAASLKVIENGFDKSVTEHHEALAAVIMSACDLSAATKPWAVSKRISHQIIDEFLAQGDQEKDLGRTPIPLMDRDTIVLPQSQLGFIDHIALPCYKTLAAILPATQPLLDGVRENRALWQDELNRLQEK